MTPPAASEPRPAARRLLWVAVAASALLALAGGAAFYAASRLNAEATRDQVADAVMTVVDGGCTPNELSVPGGYRRFEIVNQSSRPIEWEILDGVMVVAERENIAPGFRQTLAVQLRPGDYEMACGLLSNPRGVLHVLPSEEATAAASEVTIRKFLGPLAEYRVATLLGAGKAANAAGKLADAIAAGDLETAQAAWRAARLPYRQIEPLAARISDLENRIDPLPLYLDQRESDPGFTGYHRLEYGLFAQNSTEGLSPVAEQLVADLEALAARLKDIAIDPALLMAVPADTARLLADTQVPLGENAYAGSDLEEFSQSAAALRRLKTLFDPLLGDIDPALQQRLAGDLDAIDANLAALGTPDTFPAYADVDGETRAALAGHFAALADDFATLPTVLGMP